MSIYSSGTDNIVGSYFYENLRIEIILKGNVTGNQVILNEYDIDGKITGTFKGTMQTVDKITGTWESPDGNKSFPFELSLKSIIYEEAYGKRYSMALYNKSDADVENFAAEIQNDIIGGNSEKLADKILFPIEVTVGGKLKKIYRSDFLKNYDSIMNPDFKLTMINAFPKYMFVNWQGIMFGGNMHNVWINDMEQDDGSHKLMITAFNN